MDGTTLVNALVSLADMSGFTITFDAPVRAFGASFGGMQNSALRTVIEVAGTTVTPPQQVGDTIQFFGLVSDTTFTTLRFVGLANDGFGMDNVLFSAAAPVPGPGGSALALGALAMLAAGARRRPKPA